jgi:RsiW-degrading membrane proteinase PrsW (M82 family)
MQLDPNTIALLKQLGYDNATIETLASSLFILAIPAVVVLIATAVIARRKGRSWGLWLLFGLSIPVLPLILVCLLPRVPKVNEEPEALEASAPGRPPDQ